MEIILYLILLIYKNCSRMTQDLDLLGFSNRLGELNKIYFAYTH